LGPQLLRPDGTVIAFGGTTTNASAHTAIYATSSGTWTQGPDVLSTCGAQNNGPCTLADSGAALLSNGSVLFAAAPANWPTRGSFLPGTHFFELSPSNGYTQVSDPPNASSDPSYVNNLVVLPTGDILRTNLSSNVFIYTPTDKTFNSSWQPVVTSVPSCVSPNGTYTASGTQFNGLSQGSAYGDDYQSDTNFPLVRIELNGHKYYARTFNHSSRSIATGAAGSTSFQVASATELGAATLYVVANGIPSAGTAVTISTSCGGGGSMVATHDFSGDSKSDISWRQNTGAAAVWLMNGAQVTQSVGFGTVANSWVVVGQRDFDGNGKHDWLWRDSGGNAAIWFLNGTQISSTASLGAIATNWAIVGTGDFNGDGKGDILWRDSQTGTVAIWLMNGSQVAQSAGLGAVPSNWVIAAAGDFNGDGKYDILWRDSQTGTVAIWLLNGTQVIQSASLGAVPSNWSISDVGDFNGDGKWDILWRDSSGAVAIWFLNGTQVSSSVGVTTVSTAWTIWLTGDYNGDGKSDLLWKDTSGNVAMWFMNGAQVASSVGISNVGTSWSINWIGAE
jgi:sRNA-binding regulator protein Hfq